MGGLFAVAVPFAKHPLGELEPFLPVLQSALITSEAVTGVLILGQNRTQHSLALLILAAGYFFSAFMAVVHLLSSPGLFAPAGLLGAGAQTAAWLYFIWHAIFPLFVLGYCFVDPRDQAMIGGDTRASGWMAPAMLAGVVALVAGVTLLCTVFEPFLPVIMQGNQDAPAKAAVSHVTWLLSVLALVGLVWRRRQSRLDLWLIVIVCAWFFDVGLAASLNHARFDLGWYAGQVFGLVAALLVLTMLLLENSTLYRQVLAMRDRERCWAIERLRDSERHFEAIFEQAPVGIAHLSLEGKWLRINARLQEVLGGVAQLQTWPDFLDLLHPDDAANGELWRQRMLAGEVDRETQEQRYVRADRSLAWLRITAALVRDMHGRPDYFIAVIEDVTSRRLAENKVHALSREMARLSQLQVAVQTMAALAHELNQPLSAVSAAAKAAKLMLESGHWSTRRLCEMVEASGQAALRAGAVLEDMVSFINQGKMSVDPLDLNELVTTLVDSYRHHHAATDYAIGLDLQAGLPPVLANRLRIEKVLGNLIDNGIEAMLDAGGDGEVRLTVTTRNDRGSAQLSVADSGSGLDPGVVDRIFDPFFTTKSRGLGMGLAVSRAIVESHGGRLWAESPPHGGAVFHLTLPFAP
nr:MASE4 domain-containing protein [Azoarcus sp. L1K30]